MSLQRTYQRILEKAKVYVLLPEQDITFLPISPFDRGRGWYILGKGSLYDFTFEELEVENEKIKRERQKQHQYSFNNIGVYEALIRTLYRFAKKVDEDKRDSFIKEYLKQFVREHEVIEYKKDVI